MERRVAARIAAKRPMGPAGSTSESGSTDVMTDLINPGDYDFDDNESGAKKRIPPVMESGIRASQPDEHATIEAARPMSFTVYKLEDLDARARVSAPPPAPPPEPSLWPAAWASTKAVVTTYWSWRTQIGRPTLKDAMSGPLAAFRTDVWAALKQLPWKKIGMYGGASVGGFLFLLVVVLTIADLTDDLKPTHEIHVTTDPVTAPVAPVATDVATDSTDAPPVAAAPATPADAPAIEIDDQAPTKKPAAKHAATTTKKKKAKVADIFNP